MQKIIIVLINVIIVVLSSERVDICTQIFQVPMILDQVNVTGKICFQRKLKWIVSIPLCIYQVLLIPTVFTQQYYSLDV